MDTSFSLVVATDQNRGIGKNGDLPWRLKKDMQYFKDITTNTVDRQKQNAVIMGRTTWDSIPTKFRPLPNRHNIVLTRNKDFDLNSSQTTSANSIDSALTIAKELNAENVYIIGGGNIYNQCIDMMNCKKIYITEVDNSFECDTFFPEFKSTFQLIKSSEIINEGNDQYQFNVYERININ